MDSGLLVIAATGVGCGLDFVVAALADALTSLSVSGAATGDGLAIWVSSLVSVPSREVTGTESPSAKYQPPRAITPRPAAMPETA